MKNRISMISTLPPCKGVSPYTLGLVKELSKEVNINFIGFKSLYPNFLYPGGSKTDEKEPNIKDLEVKNIVAWYNPISWIKVGLKIDTDIVHVQWWSWFLAPVYLTALSIAKVRKKKIIMTIHNVKPHEKSWIKNILNNSVLKLSNEYIVHSLDNLNQFKDIFNTNKKIHIIPHGIIEFPKNDKTKSYLRDKYNLKDSDKLVLFFGNIRDYKGLDDLLNAMQLINNNKLKLIIAGNPWGSWEKYDKLIKKNALEDSVKLFLGYNSNLQVSELFKLSDIVIFPYKEFEASSGAGSVALDFEKPLVVTSVGGLPELVIDKNVISKPNNPGDLKDKIQYALKNLKKLTKQSRLKKKNFTWKSIAKKTLEVYR